VSAANAKATLHRGRINGDALPSVLLVGKVENWCSPLCRLRAWRAAFGRFKRETD